MTIIRIGKEPEITIDAGSSEPITLRDFFNGIGFETEQGHVGIARRDDGVEVMIGGALVWSSTTNPTPDKTIKRLRSKLGERPAVITMVEAVDGCLTNWIVDGHVDDSSGKLKSDLADTVRATYEAARKQHKSQPVNPPHREAQAALDIANEEIERERANAIAFASERNEARAERDEALGKVEALAALLEAKGTAVKGWHAGTPITEEVRHAPYTGPVVNVSFAQGTNAADVQRGIEAMFAAALGTADAEAIAAAEHRRLAKLLDAHDVIAVEERIVWNPNTGTEEPQRHNLSTVARVGKVVEEAKHRRTENRRLADRVANLEAELGSDARVKASLLEAEFDKIDKTLDNAAIPVVNRSNGQTRTLSSRVAILAMRLADQSMLRAVDKLDAPSGTDSLLIERRLVEDAREWIATVDDGTSAAAVCIVDRLDALLERLP